MDVRTALSDAQARLVPTARDRAALRMPKLDTRLIAVYQPATMREVGEAEPGAAGPSAVGGEPPEGAPGGVAPLGLSEARNPQTVSRRYGTKGLTANGARNIQRATAWMQDRKNRLAFWTVTLPDDVADWLLDHDQWNAFQTRVRDALVRAQKEAGLAQHCVAVVELHPARSMRRRRPVPHIHVVFVNRKRDHGPWVLTTEHLDTLIRTAARWAGAPRVDTRAAGNVQPVRKNCGAYLSKYMVKNRNLSKGSSRPDNLPRVWWFWSGATRSAVMALVVELPWGFVQWVHRLAERELVALGLHRQRLELPDPRAPVTWVLSWRSPASVRDCVDGWLSVMMETRITTSWAI